MSLVIPVWAIVTAVAFMPLLIGYVASLRWPGDGGMFDFSPLFTLVAFAVSAGVCWTGLIVWAVMR